MAMIGIRPPSRSTTFVKICLGIGVFFVAFLAVPDFALSIGNEITKLKPVSNSKLVTIVNTPNEVMRHSVFGSLANKVNWNRGLSPRSENLWYSSGEVRKVHVGSILKIPQEVFFLDSTYPRFIVSQCAVRAYFCCMDFKFCSSRLPCIFRIDIASEGCPKDGIAINQARLYRRDLNPSSLINSEGLDTLCKSTFGGVGSFLSGICRFLGNAILPNSNYDSEKSRNDEPYGKGCNFGVGFDLRASEFMLFAFVFLSVSLRIVFRLVKNNTLSFTMEGVIAAILFVIGQLFVYLMFTRVYETQIP